MHNAFNRTVNYGYCTSDCTSYGLPTGGVTVFASFLHSHDIATALNLRHIRNGIELPPIDYNWAFDFDYQQTTAIDNIVIMPGDDIILECYYNSMNRDSMTYGGIATTDEMWYDI